jgi:hypothetical protein
MKQLNKQLNKQLATFAIFAVLALLQLIPAHAQTTISGPLLGSCTSSSGTPVGIEKETFYSSDGSGNTITYMVETECLVKGALSADVAVVVYNVNASCNTALCPATATIASLVDPAAHSNNQAKGASATINSATASGLTINIATNGADGTPVQIFTGTATLNSFPTHGKHSVTVALFGSVTISAGGLFPDVAPDFSVQWQK